MNRYILIRRLKGPAVLLLLGVIALLHQADLVSWKLFVPLLLILLGVLQLAERMSLAAEPDYPPTAGVGGAPYPGQPYTGAANYGAGQTVTQPGTSIVPARDEFEREENGGQS
jgi:hypothetical protein